MATLKAGIHVETRSGLRYVVEDSHPTARHEPWLGNAFAFLYDFSMTNSVFPRKFGADMGRHYSILAHELEGTHGEQVLELGTGSGSACHFLCPDNCYTGVDVSPGLLKLAARRFVGAGFKDPEFYVVSAADLPFEEGTFGVCLCILSLNFIGDVQKAVQEVSRVLRPGGLFVCTVPVPERNRLKRTIRGVLYSEAELERFCRQHGLGFEPVASDNGALLYFRAVRQRAVAAGATQSAGRPDR